jgi:hypothetical protein
LISGREGCGLDELTNRMFCVVDKLSSSGDAASQENADDEP